MTTYLLTVKDPLSQVVRLTENCYKFHILQAHPELTECAQISRAIASPDLIARDVIDPQRQVYYRTYQTHPKRWLKVVVEQGEVVTAYRVRRLKKGETVRWQR